MVSEERQTNHKGGRPKKEVKRTVTSLRLTIMERYIIKNKSAKAGLSITQFIRKIAIEGKVIARMNEEERQFVRQLVSMSNNFNQVAKKAHQEGILTAMFEFEKYRDQIDEVLQRLKR